MGREKLLNDPLSFSATSDEAAITLADLGDSSTLPAILDSIARDCGWEVIPDRKIGAFVRLADVSTVPPRLLCSNGSTRRDWRTTRAIRRYPANDLLGSSPSGW